MRFNKAKSMNTLDQISYKKTLLRLSLLLLPLSWVTAPALVSMNSFGVWNILRFLPLKCPLVVFFGIQCPTCGLGRSLIYAWSGNFSLSLHYHFLGVIIYFLSYVIYFAVLFSIDWKRPGIQIYKQIPKAIWIILLLVYTAWGFHRSVL